MLVLEIKTKNVIYIGTQIKIKYLASQSSDGGIIRLGICAPRNQKIVRESEIDRYFNEDELEIIRRIDER